MENPAFHDFRHSAGLVLLKNVETRS